jgi:hypothetical protein
VAPDSSLKNEKIRDFMAVPISVWARGGVQSQRNTKGWNLNSIERISVNLMHIWKHSLVVLNRRVEHLAANPARRLRSHYLE